MDYNTEYTISIFDLSINLSASLILSHETWQVETKVLKRVNYSTFS